MSAPARSRSPGSAPVRIADVADVIEAPAPAFGDALIDGKPGVLVSVAGAVRREHACDDAARSRRPWPRCSRR